MSVEQVSVCIDDYFDVEDYATNIIEQLQDLVQKHGPTVYIEREYGWGDSECYKVYYKRPENEEERMKRTAKRMDDQARQEVADLEKLAELKAKYEK